MDIDVKMVKNLMKKNPRFLESLPSLDRKVVVAHLRDLDKGKSEGG